MTTTYIESDLTGKIISAFYHVYNSLGYGFLEKVYENALSIELHRRGLGVEQQAPVTVWYEGEKVGDYYADLLVEQKVLVELKSVSHLSNEHFAQLLNYLKATDLEIGLLLNFGPRPIVRRKIMQSARQIDKLTENI